MVSLLDILPFLIGIVTGIIFILITQHLFFAGYVTGMVLGCILYIIGRRD